MWHHQEPPFLFNSYEKIGSHFPLIFISTLFRKMPNFTTIVTPIRVTILCIMTVLVTFVPILSWVFEVKPTSLGHPLYMPSPLYLVLLLKNWHLQFSQSQTHSQLGIEYTKLPYPSRALLSTLSIGHLTNLWCLWVLQNHL